MDRLPYPLRSGLGATLGMLPADFWQSVMRVASDKAPPHLGSKVRKGLRTVARARSLEEMFGAFVDEWAGEESPVKGGAGSRYCGFDLDVGRDAPGAVRMMYADAISYLPDDIMAKVDRASMAVALETRAPYLDHRVAEVAAAIPISMKIDGSKGKMVLRKLLYREAPADLFERPKTGFGIPVGEWIKGPLRPWAEELLDPQRMASEGWFDPAIVQRRWQEHLSGRRDSTPALWAVLMFQAWLREQGAQLAAAA